MNNGDTMTNKNELLKELEDRKKSLKKDIKELGKDKTHILKLKQKHRKDIQSLEESKNELLESIEKIKQKVNELDEEISNSEEVRDMLKSQVDVKQKEQDDINEDIKKDLAIWSKLQRGVDKLVASIQDSDYEIEFMNGDTTMFTGEELINAKVLQVSVSNTDGWKEGDYISVDGKVGKIVKVGE